MRAALPLLFALATLPALAAGASPSRDAVQQAEDNAARVYESAVSSVVQIDARWTQKAEGIDPNLAKLLGKQANEPEPQHIIGSGVVWDDAGHVVTMAEVAVQGGTFSVTLADGSHRTAKVLGSDPTLDISVLQLEGPVHDLHPIAAGTSQGLRVGQHVYVIGSPYGLTNMLSEGLLGGISRHMAQNGHATLVLGADVNPGNAGGPVLDSSGRVIGLVTGNYGSGRSPGFAMGLPIDDIASVVARLIADGRIDHPRLGIQVDDGPVVADLPAGLPEGVRVAGVDPGGAAERAGVRARDGDAIDVITAIDSVAIASFADLRKQLDKHRTGDHATLTIWRSGQTRVVPITLQPTAR